MAIHNPHKNSNSSLTKVKLFPFRLRKNQILWRNPILRFCFQQTLTRKTSHLILKSKLEQDSFNQILSQAISQKSLNVTTKSKRKTQWSQLTVLCRKICYLNHIVSWALIWIPQKMRLIQAKWKTSTKNQYLIRRALSSKITPWAWKRKKHFLVIL